MRRLTSDTPLKHVEYMFFICKMSLTQVVVFIDSRNAVVILDSHGNVVNQRLSQFCEFDKTVYLERVGRCFIKL